MITWDLEDFFGRKRVAGVDEVGYGAWAGPILVAAVLLHPDAVDPHFLSMIRDSKTLSQEKREALFTAFEAHPSWGSFALAQVTIEEIEQKNALQMTLQAMASAAESLTPSAILIDGCYPIPSSLPQKSVIKGDSQSFSIGLASIVAKVSRDRLLTSLALSYPAFQWHKNKGYGTAFHEKALLSHGPTPHHRLRYCDRVLKKRENFLASQGAGEEPCHFLEKKGLKIKAEH